MTSTAALSNLSRRYFAKARSFSSKVADTRQRIISSVKAPRPGPISTIRSPASISSFSTIQEAKFLSCKKFCPRDLRGEAPRASRVDMISEILTWQILCSAKLPPNSSRECESSLQVIHKQFSTCALKHSSTQALKNSRIQEFKRNKQSRAEVRIAAFLSTWVLGQAKVLLAIFCDGKAYVLL